MAALLDPSLPPNVATLIQQLFSIYLFYAGALVLVTMRRHLTNSEKTVVNLFDFSVSASIMIALEGPNNPFFPFFIFLLLTAALRWNWAVVIATAVSLLAVLGFSLAVGVLSGRKTQAAVRATMIVVCAVMLVYFSVFRERSRFRFARLAAWPAPNGQDDYSLAPPLEHAAKLLRLNRIVVLWDEADEPFRRVCVWAVGRLTRSGEAPGTFGEFPTSTAVRSSTVPGTDRLQSSLSQRFFAFFEARAGLCVPFNHGRCIGCVVFLDRAEWSEDDLAIAEIICTRVAIELDNLSLRKELQEGAARNERERLARDLHDGLLQGLAAAMMHLRLDGLEPVPAVEDRVGMVRQLLAEEAQRVRRFVEQVRTYEEEAGGLVSLGPELLKRAEQLEKQWDCTVSVKLPCDEITVPLSTASACRHILSEAVSNAVRHGNAREIDAEVETDDGKLVLRLRDNGNGFANLRGAYTHRELASSNVRPRSIWSRVEEFGGSVYVASSGDGVDMRIELEL